MENLNKLIDILKNEGFDIDFLINSKKSLNEKPNFTRLEYIFDTDLSTKEINIKELKIRCILLKIRYLNNYLIKQKNIDLALALSYNPVKLKKILNGIKKPSKFFINTLCSYFFLEDKYLLDDSLQLPKEDELKIDEEIYKYQIKDKTESKKQKRMKFFEEYRSIPYKKKKGLLISTLAIIIPLLAYIGVCTYLITNEKLEDIKKYEEGSVDSVYDLTDETQTKLYNDLQTTSKEAFASSYYCDVTVGTKIYKIFDIDASSSTYSAQIELYYIFNKEEFETTFNHYANNVLLGSILDDWLKEDTTNIFSEGDLQTWKNNHLNYFNSWITNNIRNYYPGEIGSNVYTDNLSMFKIGNGSIVPDTLSYTKDLEEYMLLNKNTNTLETYCYQKMYFDAKFSKSFDSYRYPLENVQFKMYIQPTMDAQYIRYIPDTSTNDDGDMLSGVSTYFSIGGGYKLVSNTDKIKNFTLRLNYYQDVNNDPSIEYSTTIKTQLEIILRAERSGISLFLKAFINLFSVVIWIIIAFYNQAYNKEDSLGMLGTGLFGVISSILVGLNLISDAGIFSLVTMINIFTLAVIMIMTYESIAAKRANVLNNKIMISYNSIKLKILFVTLVVSTLIMFVCLPLISWL